MLLIPALILGLSLGLIVYWVFSLTLPKSDEVGVRRQSLPQYQKWMIAHAHRAGRWVLDLLRGSASRFAQELERRADRLALQADRPGAITGIEVVGFTVLIPLVAAGFLVLYAGTFLSDALGPILLVGIPLSGALPFLYLWDLRGDRLRRMRNAFPLALDLLTLCIEAGMDFTEGMKLLANRCAGLPVPVARKRPDYGICKLFAELLQDIQMGTPRNQALQRLEAKTGLPEIGNFATTLSLADETGGSVAENLRRLSGEMRNTRILRAEEHIAKAPVKLVFPIALFLFPVLFLIIFGPIGLSLVESMKF